MCKVRQNIALFDVAGTLIEGNPWRGLLKYPGMGRLRTYGSYPLIAPPYWAKNAGLISDARFRQIWIRQMARLLRGKPRAELREMFRWIAEDFDEWAYQEDVVARLKQHTENDDYVLLISGMFTEMTDAFAKALGADAGIGTTLAYDKDDICLGRIEGEGCAGEQKPVVARQHLQRHGLNAETAYITAYADSYSDMPLLTMANTAVATYPNEKLHAEVQARGWEQIGSAV